MKRAITLKPRKRTSAKAVDLDNPPWSEEMLGSPVMRRGRVSKFPRGWDEERVRRVLSRYEQQTEAEAVAEDEALFEDTTQAVMEVSGEPGPAILKLAKRLAQSRRTSRSKRRPKQGRA